MDVMDWRLSFLVTMAKEKVVCLVARKLSAMVWKFARCKLMAYVMQPALPFSDTVCPYLIEKGLTFLLRKTASAVCNLSYVNGLKNKIIHFFQRMMHRQPEQQIPV